jgi:hypothetical protein
MTIILIRASKRLPFGTERTRQLDTAEDAAWVPGCVAWDRYVCHFG